MAREGVSYEQVAAAADAMVASGQNPTIRKVREQFESGSPNTVHKHLKRWRAERPAMPAAAIALPDALVRAIKSEIEQAATRARAEIEDQLVSARTEADELSAAGERLEAEREGLIDQITALTTERDTLAGRADEQRAELDRLRAAVDAAQAERQAAAQNAAVLTARLEAVEARASAAEEREREARAEAKAAREETASLRGQLAARMEDLKLARQRLDTMHAPVEALGQGK